MAGTVVIREPRVASTDDHQALTRQLTDDGRWENAKAKAESLPHKVWKVGEGRYRVHSASSPELWHYISQDLSGNWRCGCAAASYGQACWHVAALAMRLEREYRAPRLSDFEETPWGLFDGEDARRDVDAETGEILEAPAAPVAEKVKPSLLDLYD